MNNEIELFEELEFFEKQEEKIEPKVLTPEERLDFEEREILENWWNRLWNMEV